MWWHNQAHQQMSPDLVTYQGLNAYAAHQLEMLELLAASCVQKWLPVLLAEGIALDWGMTEVTNIDLNNVSYPTTADDLDGGAEWLDKDDDEERTNPFDSYELDD